MSWSVSTVGTRDKAKEEVGRQFDTAAANYAGKPEADDIIAAKGRALALIDELDLSNDGHTDWNAVKVSAYGSHGWTNKGLTNASFNVSVERTHLAL